MTIKEWIMTRKERKRERKNYQAAIALEHNVKKFSSRQDAKHEVLSWLLTNCTIEELEQISNISGRLAHKKSRDRLA